MNLLSIASRNLSRSSFQKSLNANKIAQQATVRLCYQLRLVLFYSSKGEVTN